MLAWQDNCVQDCVQDSGTTRSSRSGPTEGALIVGQEVATRATQPELGLAVTWAARRASV